MTKKEAVQTIEKHGVKVIGCRMDHGTPKVTISWREFLKIRDIAEVMDGKILVAMKVVVS